MRLTPGNPDGPNARVSLWRRVDLLIVPTCTAMVAIWPITLGPTMVFFAAAAFVQRHHDGPDDDSKS